MTFANKSKWVSVSCSLALAAIVGCNSNKSGEPPKTSESKLITFPQTSEPIVVDAAHPPAADATVKRVYVDPMFGKTEVRSDDYIRHADSVAPSGWTPWHYRSQPHNWTGPLTYETSLNGTWTAHVEWVDAPKRMITLQGPSGRSEQYEVSPTVERLNEVSPGDNVKVAWVATLHGELRKPTPEEAADPIKVLSLVDRASSDAAPSGTMGSALRVVTTIDAVDLTAMTVTLKGPLGNRIDVKAKSPENIRKLRVGDTVVVTYTRAVAMSLVKTP